DPPLPDVGLEECPLNNLQLISLESGGFADFIEHWIWVPWPIPFGSWIPDPLGIDWSPEGTGLTTNQVNWLNSALDLHPSYQKILFMHHPVVSYGTDDGESVDWDGCIFNNRNTFKNTVRDTLSLVLGGHLHHAEVNMENSNGIIKTPIAADGYCTDAQGKNYWDISKLVEHNYHLPLYIVTSSSDEDLGYRKIVVDTDNIRVYEDQGLDNKGSLMKYLLDVINLIVGRKGTPSIGENEINITAAARLHVYDSEGNHIGINETGGIDFEIPDALYRDYPIVNETTGELLNWSLSELISVFCDSTDSYTYEIETILNCTVNLTGTFRSPDAGDTITKYSNVTLYAGSKGKLFIENGTVENILYLDDDGDGDIDREIPPTSTQSPPEIPTIQTRLLIGITEQEYDFNVSSVDPQSDSIYYMFDWGDGNYSDWVGPYQSGETITESHSWTQSGKYTVQARAMDSTGRLSNWSEPIILDIINTSNLKRTWFVGFISNPIKSEDLTCFNATHVLSISMKPFKISRYTTEEKIVVSNNYLGRIGSRFIIGRFEALLLSASTSSTIHHLREDLKHLINSNP
ncbi:MAG: PKD domain-containing protein, partial [Euryarchaeota archaeon]|nr:PKD domain-containing protein [Euryarchaeota archaeon]